MKGYVSDKYDFGYKFIPKVACTSIKDALLEAEGRHSATYYKVVKRGNAKGWGFSNYKLIKRKWNNAHKMVESHMLGDIDYCGQRFIVIRDPVKRFISAYRNRVLFHGQLNEEFIKREFPKVYPDIPKFRPSISEFIEHFHTYRRVNAIEHHCKSFSKFLEGNDLSFFTDIYKMEELNKFEIKLSTIFSKKIVFPKKQKGGPKIGIGDLNRAELDFIFELYADDYLLLKDFYKPEYILDEWNQARR